MPDNVDNRIVTVSVKIYGHLLAACPAEFRREYGSAMRQLFRDQCRDAWSEARGWGLTLLWLRVLPDLAKTSLIEHLTNLNQKESTLMKIVRAFRSDPKVRVAFLKAFALVIVCVLGWSAFMAYWNPRIYSGTARIEAQKSMAEINFAGIGQTNRSRDPFFLTTLPILSTVVSNMNLRHVLASQAGEPDWSFERTVVQLKNRINVAPTPDTALIEISVRNASPEIAADIANDIIRSYQEQIQKLSGRHDSLPEITVRDPARPNLRSGLHNEFEAFKASVIKGMFLAVLAGAASAWLSCVIRRSNRQHGAPP